MFERKKITEIALLISMKYDNTQDHIHVKICEAWIHGTIRDHDILEVVINTYIEDYGLEETAKDFYEKDIIARELIDDFRESSEKKQMIFQ